MKKVIPFVLFFGIASVAVGEVSTRICLADGNTPLEYQDIMVGTKLTIIVSSDTGGCWAGDLAIKEGDRDYGFLSEARSLEAAGELALFYPWNDDLHQGFCFQTEDDAVAGDWFIVDYIATDVGDCDVGFYEWFAMDPTYEIPFTHVRTRDFNNDITVDFVDFAVLASYWQVADCNDPNWCEGTDLDTDGNVDVNDLMLFTDYWLERTE